MELHDLRKMVNETLLQKNSIDRLFTDKVEDYILIKEQPMPIRIGKKTIFIGNFNIDTEIKFFEQWAQIISLMMGRICNWKLSEERKKELLAKNSFFMLAEGIIMKEFITRDKWFIKQIFKLIERTVLKQQAYFLNNVHERELINWTNCDIKYFRENVTSEELIQICYMIYLYNFDSVKKNAILFLDKMNMKALSETFIPFWLQNMPGLTGPFLRAQAPNIDWSFKDNLKDNMIQRPIPQEQKQENDNG